MIPSEDTIRGRSLTINNRPSFMFGGEIHYFRIPQTHWNDRLKKTRAAFINTIGSYIPWNLHEPEKGIWRFDGGCNLRAWIESVRKSGMQFFARPGPYICSEWDMGGLPPWLIGEADAVRTVDPHYMAAVSRWFHEVNRILRDFLPEAGGNLILYQIENEFLWGELQYFLQMADIVRRDGITSPLVTNLNPSVRRHTPITDTLDLYPGPWNVHKSEVAIADLLEEQPEKPAACVEFQTGFAAEAGSTLPTMVGMIGQSWVEVHIKDCIARGLNLINFYMFCGGTTFGYHTGRRDITSYDYDSAIREWGELDGKYYMVRRIGSFLHHFGNDLVQTLPDGDIPVQAPRGVSVLRRSGYECVFLFPRNLTRSPQEITLRIEVPGQGGIPFPAKTALRLAPQSMKILPVNIPLGGAIRLVYSTSEVFGVYRLEDELIIVVYGEPGEPGEILIGGYGSFDHSRGNAAVEKTGDNLLVSFTHTPGFFHILLVSELEDELSNVLGGIRIIVADRATAEHTWIGIRGVDRFPIMSNLYFMDIESSAAESLFLAVSMRPGDNQWFEFPCNCTPIIPPTVSFNGENLKTVTVNKLLKTVRVELPPVEEPLYSGTMTLTGWTMEAENPLALSDDGGWKPYNAFRGNEHSGQFDTGYYGYRCSFGINDDPGGKSLHLTEIHDNAVVYLNGVCLGGVIAYDSNGSRYSADVSEILRRDKQNELFVLLESEGRPRKGDEAAVTGITGPVILSGLSEDIPLVSWKRTVLRFETESMLGAVPSEALPESDDSGWETVSVRPGWDSRIVIPPSTTYIEHGHERLYVVYRTSFQIDGKNRPGGCVLDIGKADGKCWIYLNGRPVDKKHQERFCADLTPYVTEGENVLVIILRNFRWYTTIGLRGAITLRCVDRVLGDGWECIHGLPGQRKGFPETGMGAVKNPPENVDFPGMAWFFHEFAFTSQPGWTAPPGLTLKGWNAKILIYLNGFLIGRYHPDGPQERFYLPEDRLADTNRLVLFCNAFGKPLKTGSAEIGPYYRVKEGMIEIGF